MFALYVAGYSGFRIFEETLRIDYSEHILGLRLNFFVALVLCLVGLVWFVAIQTGWHGFGGPKTEPEPATTTPTSRRRTTPPPPPPRRAKRSANRSR